MNQQDAFFNTGVTYNKAFRKEALRRLNQNIKTHEKALILAFLKDLQKPPFETYATEIGVVYAHLRYVLKNMDWKLRDQWKFPDLKMGQKKVKVKKMPKGHILIIVPFNYPFQLAMIPLIDALACGNVVTLKLSEYTPHVNGVLQTIIQDSVNESLVKVVEGDADTTQKLLEQAYDHIFFTGSPRVGSIVMQSAAKHLSPVTLELGGKCPVIIDETADLRHAAQSIMWGKCLNTGQTCVAPDTLYIKKGLETRFIHEARKAILDMYTEFPEMSRDYGRIINERHADRLRKILDRNHDKIVYGGRSFGRFVEPTLLLDAPVDEEIFGPILPIIPYNKIEEVDEAIDSHPYPLAIYLYTQRKALVDTFEKRHRTGALMVNEVILHAGSDRFGFGGIRTSGIGRYHGNDSFETFSHTLPVVHNISGMSRLMRAPYDKPIHNLKIFRHILK